MHTIFRWFIAISVLLFLSLTGIPPTLAQTMEMPSPTPGFGPLAPPCETNPNGASCGSGLDLPAAPVNDNLATLDDAIKLVEEEIKALEDAREAAQKCLEGGGDATCEPFDIPSGTDCPQGPPSGDCIDPPAPTPSNAQTVSEAIKFIEGLLQDPEPDTPPLGFPVFGPDGNPIGDMEQMLQEAIDRLSKEQSCAAIAKLQAQKEQMEFELAKTRSEILEIQANYAAERTAIRTANVEKGRNFEDTFNALKDQLEDLRVQDEVIYEHQLIRGLEQWEIDALAQNNDLLENLYWTYSRMIASRQRIQLSGGERLANSYKNYLDRVVPKWNIRGGLEIGLQEITAQLDQLSTSCK